MSTDTQSAAAGAVGRRSAVRSLLDGGYFVIRVVAVVALFAILVQTLAHVVARYFFNSGVPNTLELVSAWYMPIAIFLGFVVAKAEREHIEARLIFDKLSPKNQRALRLFISLLAVVITALFAVLTLQMALKGFSIKETVGYAGLIVWPVYFVLPFSFAITSLLYVADFVDDVRGRSERTESLEPHIAVDEEGASA